MQNNEKECAETPGYAENSSTHCFRCGAPLGEDDEGATKRFINRDCEKFLCMSCLCRELSCTEEFLRTRIEFLRKNGCLLFPPKKH